MKRKNTGILILLALVIVLILFFVYIQLSFSGTLNFPVREITRSVSPDAHYIVIIEQLGDAGFPFGPVTSRITVQNAETGKILSKVKEEVFNDGTGLYESQIMIQWLTDSVTVQIDPSDKAEQIALTFQLNP